MRSTWLAIIFATFAVFSSLAQAGTLEELENRARSGEIDAQVELGYRYLHGLGVEKDLYEARRWLQVPANEASLPYAMTMLGLAYWDENLSTSDHQRALEIFGNALELGDADAYIYFGWMTATGLGTTENRDAGIRYIETGQTLGADGAADMLLKLADMGTTITVPYAGYEGCEIEFVTGEAYRAWRWTARQLKLVWTQEPEMDQFLCEQTENLPVAVTEYLGKAENEPAYYFAVTFDDCNMEFEVTRSDEGFHHKTTYDRTCHRYVPPAPATSRPSPSTGTGSSVRCVSVSGDCTGLDCIIDKITLSGGPGDIDNSWSTPMVCSGYNGALNGTYNYVMETNFDRVCSGSFQISSQAQSGVTVNIYDNCSAGYVSEY